MMRRWRDGLCAALLGTAACTADFVTEASPPVDVLADAVWPDTLARTDTITLSVALSVAGTGDTLAGPEVTWTSSDPGILTLTTIAPDPAAGLPRRARAIATARVPGRVQVTVKGSRAGLNTTTFTDSIVVLERWIAVTAGDLYTCALNVLHEAYCWGGFSWRVSGNDVSPQRVAEGMTFSSISAGADYFCGVRDPAPAQAYCMGDGRRGALGNRAMEFERSPVIVGGGIQLFAISAGQATTCGILRSAGGDRAQGADCWGYAATGQLLGVDLDAAGAVPCGVPIFDEAMGEEKCTSRPSNASALSLAITIGRLHSCALQVRGVPVCWGSNLHGQLGIDTTIIAAAQCQLREISALGDYPCLNLAMEPSDINFDDAYLAIAAAGFHSCAVRFDGVASCWGLNDNGQLGDGTRVNRTTPVPVATTLRFTTVVAAGSRTVSGAHTCALTADGAAYCWGANNDGQLGDGTRTRRLTPVAVAGQHAFASLTAGTGADQEMGHTCGVRKGDGAMYCWGTNQYGQLGLGTSSSGDTRPTPVRVKDPR